MSASRITFFRISFTLNEESSNDPVDTGRKLNVHNTLRRRLERLPNVLYTFNLRPVSTGDGLK